MGPTTTVKHPKTFGRAFALGIVLNTLYVVLEAGVGPATGSLAQVAETGHKVGDVLSLVVAWEAVGRLQAPDAVPGLTIVWVTLVGRVVYFGRALLFIRGREDLNVRGAFLHIRADGLVTLVS